MREYHCPCWRVFVSGSDGYYWESPFLYPKGDGLFSLLHDIKRFLTARIRFLESDVITVVES